MQSIKSKWINFLKWRKAEMDKNVCVCEKLLNEGTECILRKKVQCQNHHHQHTHTQRHIKILMALKCMQMKPNTKKTVRKREKR